MEPLIDRKIMIISSLNAQNRITKMLQPLHSYRVRLMNMTPLSHRLKVSKLMLRSMNLDFGIFGSNLKNLRLKVNQSCSKAMQTIDQLQLKDKEIIDLH
jgi:hypothetical protein